MYNPTPLGLSDPHPSTVGGTLSHSLGSSYFFSWTCYILIPCNIKNDHKKYEKTKWRAIQIQSKQKQTSPIFGNPFRLNIKIQVRSLSCLIASAWCWSRVVIRSQKEEEEDSFFFECDPPECRHIVITRRTTRKTNVKTTTFFTLGWVSVYYLA